MDVVAEDVAKAEFIRMCATYRVDTDESKMGELEKAMFEGVRRPIVKAICAGSLMVGEDGRVTYTPVDSAHVKDLRPLKFHGLTGASFIAADGGGDKPNDRLARACDQVTGSAPGTASRLGIVDFNLCKTLLQLFFDAG